MTTAAPLQVAMLQAQRLSVAFSNLGGMLKMQGRLSEAITCYEHVAVLQPHLAEVQVRTAYADSHRVCTQTEAVDQRRLCMACSNVYRHLLLTNFTRQQDASKVSHGVGHCPDQALQR